MLPPQTKNIFLDAAIGQIWMASWSTVIHLVEGWLGLPTRIIHVLHSLSLVTAGRNDALGMYRKVVYN